MTAYSATTTEYLATLDNFSSHTPHWIASIADSFVTDEVLTKSFIAIRNTSDIVGRDLLGVLTLPLLFTVGDLPGVPGQMDVIQRTSQSVRSSSDNVNITEVITAPHTNSRLPSETLVASDAVIRRQNLIRGYQETLSTSDAISAPIYHYHRQIADQTSRDNAIALLLFPVPLQDVLTRQARSVRHLGDSLVTQDHFVSSIRHPGRTYTETLTLSETATKRIKMIRRVIDSDSISEVMTRHIASRRGVSIAIVSHETTNRHWVGTRLLSDQSALVGNAEPMLAFPLPQLSSTWDRITVVSRKSRLLSETLTTVEHISFEQLLSRIMGYISTDAAGNYVAYLPDWGWGLVEDPINGNSIDIVEIPINRVDPTREK